MNRTIELQRKSAQLNSDIEDILHAASINFQAIRAEALDGPLAPLSHEFAYLHTLLHNAQQLLRQRSPLFINYLITRQIQDEETRVRRERLTEYEDKIYDQKRIITDKETFFENLLRPKRKRPSYQTPEEFMEVRAKEREAEEKIKAQQLARDIADLQSLKRLLQTSQALRKKGQLEFTKSSSISQVNMSLVGEPETATDRVIPFEDRTNKCNKSTHSRASSLQYEAKKDLMGQSCLQNSNLKEDLTEIISLKRKNEELQKIYEQAHLSLSFKRGQSRRAQAEFQELGEEAALIRKKAELGQEGGYWRGSRVVRPVVREKSAGSR